MFMRGLRALRFQEQRFEVVEDSARVQERGRVDLSYRPRPVDEEDLEDVRELARPQRSATRAVERTSWPKPSRIGASVRRERVVRKCQGTAGGAGRAGGPGVSPQGGGVFR